MSSFSPISKKSLVAWLAIIVTAYSVVRISRSYSVLCQTDDEPVHIACGMQWLDQGKYMLETLHPPVGRVFEAFLPFLDGSRSQGDTNIWSEGNKILYNANHYYWRTLTLARMGVLPLYLLSVFLLWSWSKKMFGDDVAFLAVLFFTLLPTILSNAGVATTDYPLTAGFIAACYALWWWIQNPVRKRSVIFGIVLGIAVATKFSFLVFFPVAAIVILGYELFLLLRTKLDTAFLRKFVPQLLLVLFAAVIALWGCYRFSFGPLPHSTGASYPMPEFFDGLSAIFNKNQTGHAIWFMGKLENDHGSIWFFPVGIALKTPVAFLLLAFAGAALIFLRNNAWKTKSYLKSRELLPLLVSAALLASVMPSDINLGVRHILPIYPFLAMLAALGARWLFTLPKVYGVTVFAVLLTWMFASSVSADPDDLSYFNELAGSKPEHYLIAADLDWGQDAARLIDTLHARGIDRVCINYDGSADLTALGLPRFSEFLPFSLAAPRLNWVAISKLRLYCNACFYWLLKETPTARIGNSILLFYFSDADLARLRSTIGGGENKDANTDAITDVAHTEAIAEAAPTSENFINLSAAYYRTKQFEKCIAAARKALALRPNFAEAYINICASYNSLGRFAEGKIAGEEAVRLQPENQLARNNLKWALDGLKQK